MNEETSMDKLEKMYNQQRDFNVLLRDEREMPDFPLDLSEKKNQQILKGLAHECMHELFEANHLLKNSKAHRVTEVKDFDRESYKEELVDALHYFFGIVIYSGISVDELYEAFMKKGEVNVRRVKSGY
jgi:dimeric dUTPase (all-alpha-NTP-PPase superfamily)